MALLPSRFRDAISAVPLGPVVKRTEDPVLHVHDWRPSASSKDHVACSCGQVSLREFVMPKEDFAPTQPSGAWASPEDLVWPDLGPEAKFEDAVGGLKEADLEFPTLSHLYDLACRVSAAPGRLIQVRPRLPPSPDPTRLPTGGPSETPFAVQRVKMDPKSERMYEMLEQMYPATNPPLIVDPAALEPEQAVELSKVWTRPSKMQVAPVDPVWDLFRREEQAKQNEQAARAAWRALHEQVVRPGLK